MSRELSLKQELNIPIVYEDDWLMVVNKPSGLLTIPAANKTKRTLIKILNEYIKEQGHKYRLHPCHRLDQQTSGLIIFAKGKSMQKKMMQAFMDRRVNKTYIAIVRGSPSKNQANISRAINGKSAVTRYSVLKRLADFSVVKVNPVTGRRNQIRIHFKFIGHPILGEDRFAFRRDFKVKAKRLCLHAQALEFLHPATGKQIRLKTDSPEYFKRLTKTYDRSVA